MQVFPSHLFCIVFLRLLLLVLFTATTPLLAKTPPKNIHFKRLLESEDSHRFSYITCLQSSPDGHLWIGTGQGLLSYDGQFTRLHQSQPKSTTTLTSNYIRGLAFDESNILWIATEYGLNSYDPHLDRFTQYLENSPNLQISSNYIKSVLVARDNRVYVGTANGVDILSTDRKKLLHIGHNPADPNSLSDADIVSLLESRTGDIWIATKGGGLNLYNPKTQQVTRYLNTTAKHISTLFEDDTGRLWVGTLGQGASVFEGGTFKKFKVGEQPGEIPDATVYQIMQDQTGLIWVLTDRAGVLIYNEPTDSFRVYRHNPHDPATLATDTTKAITEDKDGNIWVATFPIGLNYFDRTSEAFDFYYRIENRKPTLSHSTILDIKGGSDGRLWLGTESGLNIIDETTGEITIYNKQNTQEKIAADAVLSLQEDFDGSMWLGTWGGGLSKLDIQTGKITNYTTGAHGPGKIKSPFIWDLFLDSENTLWVGTETDGLNRYNRSTDSFISYNRTPGDRGKLSDDFIWDILEDEQGYLWIGSQFGLNRFDKKTQKFETWLPDEHTPFSISASRIQDILLDSRGYIWLATQGGGINRFNRQTEEFHALRSDKGLPSDSVSQLLEDGEGFIWAGTASGLAQIDPELLSVRTVLNEHNALHNQEFIRNAQYKASDGRLYFGSAKGVVSFHPQSLRRSAALPRARLTEFQIFNRPVPIGTGNSPLQQHISATQELNLSVKESVISLGFSAINFNKHIPNRFSYFLENFDPQWNHVERTYSATYTNLNPGKYVFRLATRDRYGNLSEAQETLTINIATPWWRSWYAILGYLLLSGLLIAVVARLFLLNYTAKRLNLLVAQRTRELEKANAAKTDFLANMSHELRTPLNSIIGFSRRMLKRTTEEQDPSNYRALDAIFRNGVHLLNIINDILDVSKIEAGKMKLEFYNCNLQTIIEQLIQDLSPRAEDKGLRLLSPENYPVSQIEADPVRLRQIVNNLLSNAIKYTQEGQISVTMSATTKADKSYCCITVTDTGIGIKKEDQKRLFSRFEQFDNSTRHMQGFGTGLGLALVNNLTVAHQGFVEFTSEFGKGSSFTVNLPLTQS